MDYLKARQRRQRRQRHQCRQRSQRWHLFCKTLTAARLRTAKSIVGFGAWHFNLTVHCHQSPLNGPTTTYSDVFVKHWVRRHNLVRIRTRVGWSEAQELYQLNSR